MIVNISYALITVPVIIFFSVQFHVALVFRYSVTSGRLSEEKGTDVGESACGNCAQPKSADQNV